MAFAKHNFIVLRKIIKRFSSSLIIIQAFNLNRSILHKILVFAFLFFCLLNLNAQSPLNGLVTDQNDEPLPFVNILINNNASNGLTTTIDGTFSIRNVGAIEQLRFSYVGYETLYYTLDANAGEDILIIKLKPSAVNIDAIEIIAGENPAHRIIRRVVRMRDHNNPEKMSAYRCQTYNKMIFDLKTNKEAIAEYQTKNKTREEKRKKLLKRYHEKQEKKLKKVDASLERKHMFIMESITDRQFMAPKTIHETITHNRVSGFKTPSFAVLANAVQPFSFYQDHLEILDKDYLNPISPGSTKAYYFNIEDTLYQAQDSIYVLSFKPRKKKNFDGLKGVLYIHSNTYAIQNVIAQPANPAFIDLKIEQQYQFVDNQQWFPKALNFELIVTNYPSKYVGVSISGRSYIDSVLINPDLNRKTFQRDAMSISDDAFTQSDSVWTTLRHEPLTEKEKATYVFVDSLGVKKKFDSLLKLTEALSTGRYPIGKVDLLLDHILRFNEYEEVRFGFGLGTNDKFSKYFNIEAYSGYGIKDKAWKYGGALNFNLLDDDRLTFRAAYSKDLKEPAIMSNSFGELFSTRLYANRMSKVEQKRLSINAHPFSFFDAEIGMSQSRWESGFEYGFTTDDILLNEFDYTTLEFNLRYAYGEQTMQVLGSRVAQKTSFPILSFGYEKGFDNLLDGNYKYDRFSVTLDHSFLLRRFGNSTYRIEAGMVEGSLPYNRLFTSNTFSNDSWLEVITNTFQTMRPYEFLSNRFVHFFFRHDFKSLLLRTKKFQPRLALIHNMGIGELKSPNTHVGIDVKTMERGFLESGIRVGDIIRIPYLNVAYIGLGAGVYHRYGPYAFPGFWDNTTVNFALDFSF